MTTRREDMAWISRSSRSHSHLHLLLLLPILAVPLAAGFGNEYVHIKVHVPKEESSAEAVPPPHKVIHHFHHHPHPHQLLRNRGRARPKASPLLESVILSDLDKPLHMSEHTEYLNHAKELADHLAETYAKKPPPPPPPKKKVNTYTIIEEQQRPHGYDYEDHQEHGVETYRVIESRPKQQHHHHHHHPHHQQQHLEAEEEEEDGDVGYHYQGGAKAHHSLGIGAYAEPAPVEEPLEQEPDAGYSYSPPSHSYSPPSLAHRGSKANRAPAYTLEAPQESAYGYDYSRHSAGSSSDFRPSVQVPSSDPYGEEEPAETYGPPRRRRPSSHVDWPEAKGFNSAAAETYSGVDSYNVGHVQGYQYSGPYL
ncbi:ETV5-related protein Ets96B [Drosophila subpulchrella]|uniref:ETV5-related protein Ets96B n=1 Tax=Drosophila subpulchrella TaxID=1486046 RepID=UPI0018A127CE|nr:ETV5-related protein Ets96B [Drosophila subpulchrella]